MKSKNVLCGLAMAVVLQLGVLAVSAQTNIYLYGGSLTNITLKPGAVEERNIQAQLRLGFLYAYGGVVQSDYGESAKWFRNAAEAGDAQGQDALGYRYEHGRGVGIDYAEALKWYRKASEGGFKLSQVRLGNMYEQGLGGDKDDSEAAKWYRKAADDGDAGGRDNLERMEKRRAAEASLSQAGSRWTNTLAMVFVPVPGTSASFSIWDTRVQDFAVFAHEIDYSNPWIWTWRPIGTNTGGHWCEGGWNGPELALGPLYPICGVSWNDAQDFCVWLTEKEHASGQLKRDLGYRLPTEEEWPKAFGTNLYSWGNQWPPPVGTGNFAGWRTFPESRENCAWTTPVGSFLPNALGLYDMGGNVLQWSEDLNGTNRFEGFLRGAAWDNNSSSDLECSHCFPGKIDNRWETYGFRCVLGRLDANAQAAEVANRQKRIENAVISFTQAPLAEAIRQLALQVGFAVEFDPALLHQKAADGTSFPLPYVTVKWKKLTPFQALQALLDNYGWQITLAPGAINFVSTKAPNVAGLLVSRVNLLDNASTNGAAVEGNQVIPDMTIEDISLGDAIQQMALQAGLNIIFDPRLANRQDVKVSVKWKNVTARQALQALLDDHGLEITQAPGMPIFRIVAKNP
jgi:hypothetical protein